MSELPKCKWVVWKYELPMSNEFTVDIPANYRILSVHPQFGKYQMWVLNDALSEPRPVLFCMVGTGQELPKLPADKYVQHVATIKQYDDTIMLHLFRAVEITVLNGGVTPKVGE